MLNRTIVSGAERIAYKVAEREMTATNTVLDAAKKMKITPKPPVKSMKITPKPIETGTTIQTRHQTFEAGAGQDIVAQQNKVMLNRRTHPITRNPIPPNPRWLEYDRLCNIGEFTAQKAEELKRLFFEKTGLTLHCPSSRVKNFNVVLTEIELAIERGQFPKDIKHVLIGHGYGSSQYKTWALAGLGLKNKETVEIFPYINNNESIKYGEKVLVCSCESKLETKIPGKPGIGDEVELCLADKEQPAKIVRKGVDEIIGHYTTADRCVGGGDRYYKMWIQKRQN